MRLFGWIQKFLFSRFFMALVIMIMQVIWVASFVFAVYNRLMYLQYGYALFYLMNLILTVYILNRNNDPSYRMAWIVFINILPAFGGLLYLLFANHKIPKNLGNELMYQLTLSRGVLKVNEQDIPEEEVASHFRYLQKYAYYPYYRNTSLQYFATGEECFAKMKEDLQQAKHFIFLEFFIVKDGRMYQEIREILKQKVEEGVEVYFMYDDGGSITTTNFNASKDLSSIGVHTAVFSPVSVLFLLLSKTNNRDHRKIVVIDNEVSYVGGLNLADEYINEISRFGYWKDTAVRLEGEAARSLTAAFIQLYDASSKEDISYEKYTSYPCKEISSTSLVQPFSDSPMDEEDVGHTVHLNLINAARKSLYIETPYLIIDHSLQTALINAVKRGVDVRIVIPHIPDKKTVFMVTRANTVPLIRSGVRVYEYTPGFIHSKMILVDGILALNGTINMDFRSYYLHYECGVLSAYDPEITRMAADFEETVKESEEITVEKIEDTPFAVIAARAFFSVFAPLL